MIPATAPTSDVSRSSANVIKVSLPVEESRAKRLERQQARFRDRGGIFVPSNRNTLIDILLNRKGQSPKKTRNRSVSCSPTKKAKLEASTQRSSSRKTRGTKDRNEDGAHTGPSRPAAKVTKPKHSKKTSSRKTGEAPDVTVAQKSQPKRRGRPPKAKDITTTIPTSPALVEELVTESMKDGGGADVVRASTKIVARKGLSNNGKGPATLPEDGKRVGHPGTKKTNARSKVSLKDESNSGVAQSGPGGRRSRATRPTKAKRAYHQLSEDEDSMPGPSSSRAPLGSESSKLVYIDGEFPDKRRGLHHRPLGLIDEDNADSTAQVGLPLSELSIATRPRPLNGICDENIQECLVVQPRKQAKPPSRSGGVEPETLLDKGRGKVVQTIKSTSKRLTKGIQEVKPLLTDKEQPVSKKRPFEASMEDIEAGQDAISLTARKRTKTSSTIPAPEVKGKKVGNRSKKATVKREIDVDDGRPSKPSAHVGPKSSTKPPVRALASSRQPPESVLKRVKKPLPRIEDDDPDPINFLS